MILMGISGSLREKSYNTGLLQSVGRCLPDGVSLTLFDCAGLPLYNGDVDADKENRPDEVQRLLDELALCDGVVFATPEYNYSISGVLKNAIDWASRPAYKSVLAGKPVAILSGAKGVVGGARAQNHLRDILSSTLSPVVPSPPFLVPEVQKKFDDKGVLSDEGTRVRLKRYIEDFVAWVNLLNRQ
jgi:chromate reductase